MPLSRWSARFALEQPAISSVVPGVKNPEELADQIAAVEMADMGDELIARIDALREERISACRSPTTECCEWNIV